MVDDRVARIRCSGAAHSEHAPVLLQQFIYSHYHCVAYTTVVVAYVVGFNEYAILRLKLLIWPERQQVYFSTCEKRANEPIGKAPFHYAVVFTAFIVVALFQLVCYFGLTISSKWMYHHAVRNEVERVTRLRQELAARIRNQMYGALFPTFRNIFAFCIAQCFPILKQSLANLTPLYYCF
ncbi:unnamed protein product [Gongylonema pulchrum]|uniref:G protein-coupled receptor n=1 Tax=Gongylonema pulchrum TaxID=637853 RepID=A0A183E495_9BILA|nr:unnamed protein product [Gongylonema pulchrum]